MFILVLLHKPSQSQFLCRGQHFAEDHGYWSFLLLLYWQAGGWRSLNIWLFFQKRNNINCKKTMSSSPIPRAVLPAGNGAEWINVLLKLMRDGKGVAVLTAEPEIRKAREIPPLQYSSHLEQALLCLRQLHFYDHNQAFFSAIFMPMCTVLKKLSQWGTAAGVSFPPCQNAIFQWLWWAPLSAGIDQHYCIQCGRTVAPEHQQRKSLNLWIKCLGSTQGKECGSTGAMLVPALQIYYYNIIMVNIIKPPTKGLLV